ncbi:hypothetical protein JCM19047_1735 [Bacillus sp. JCM 19047]|nr:hypothetical protein JCM19047_1735 [Bacillus sp. JCM 19047]
MNIKLNQVRKQIKGQDILKNINIAIDEVGIYAVLGPMVQGKRRLCMSWQDCLLAMVAL